jgi:monoamine oxidase
MVRAMMDRIDPKNSAMVMNCAVKEISWRKNKVTVHTSRAEYNAARAIVTLPLGVLKSNSVVFSPALPEKQNASSFLEMGPVVRMSLCFSEKFWEQDPEMAGLGFLFTDDPQFPTWWSSNPLPYPILTGWAAGDYAMAHSGKSRSEIVHSSLQSLARIMGVDARLLGQQMTGAFTHDWQGDPFSRGAYSYAAVGGIDAAQELAAPVAETLYFAGEATNCDGYNGTVHGAIATGQRAARELLRSL